MPGPDPSEATIVAGIMQRVEDAGGWSLKIHGHAMQAAGVPDLVVLLRGEVWFLEVKRPREASTRIQQHVQDAISQAGGHAAEVHSVEEAAAILGLPT